MGFGKSFVFGVLCILAITGTVSAASGDLTIQVSEKFITIGDIVTINGTVSDSKTRAVYLYLSGGDLPAEGTALIGDIRSGRLPRQEKYLSGPRWDYSWDTGLIVGGLDQGTYTIYVSDEKTTVNKLEEGSYASVEVEVYDPSIPTESSPSQAILLAGALAGTFLLVWHRSKD